jgi:hypothetical protein
MVDGITEKKHGSTPQALLQLEQEIKAEASLRSIVDAIKHHGYETEEPLQDGVRHYNSPWEHGRSFQLRKGLRWHGSYLQQNSDPFPTRAS